MQNLNELKSIIQGLFPEIMELKFGCKFIWNNPFLNNKELYNIIGIERYDENNLDVYSIGLFIHSRSLEDIYKFDERILKEPFKILGRDIMLEDILMAFEKKEEWCLYDDTTKTRERCEKFMPNGYDNLLLHLLKLWQLGKSLDEHSSKTIDWLLNKLK